MSVSRLPQGDLVGGLPDDALAGLFAGKFELHAQAISGDGQPWHELLLRPFDASPPAPVIAYAHQLGRSSELDRIVFKAALQLISGLPGFWSINIAATSLADPGFAAELLDLAFRTPFPATRLVLEVLESPNLLPAPALAACLRSVAELRAAGVRIALDDLTFTPHPLPFRAASILKIDREPVHMLRHPAYRRFAAGFIGSVVSAAADMGAQVVAEGVETDADLAAVADLGVRLWQGWLFGPARRLSSW